MIISTLVKSNPNFMSFNALAPNIIGMDRKKEYYIANDRDAPSNIAPSIVVPERDVPGISART